MTRTPAPALPLLDELDELRAKATADMPWRQDSGWGENILGASGEAIGGVEFPSDAALIVAAVNRLPQLTDGWRRVLLGCDYLDRIGQPEAAAHIRACLNSAVITTALEAS